MGDHVQHVHQLTLVFVDAFNLNVEQRFRVCHHVQVHRQPDRQTLFVQQLGFAHGFVHRREINMLFQLAQLAQIGTPGAADILVQHLRERLVSQRQPAARGDAVGHVAEPRREDLREVRKQRLHHQVRVELGHAVDLVADDNRQPGHAHAAAVRLINDGRAAQQAGIVWILLLQRLEEVVVNLKDNLQMARQDFAEHVHRPRLQRFAHQRVVGVREHLAGHLKGVVPAELMLVDQQAHQLRNGEHRVGVIKVDRGFLRQVGVGFVQLMVAAEDVLNGRRNEEILLTQAQLAAGVGRVIRVQHAGHVLGVVFIFHRRKVVTLVEFTEVNLATGLGAPQAQRVGGIGVIAGDNLVVGHGQDLFRFYPAGFFAFLLDTSAKAHLVARIVALKLPRVAVLQPVVRRLFLAPVDDVLFEHTVVVANTVAAARQRQRCQRVEEAGGETPQAAVAEARVVLFVDQLF